MIALIDIGLGNIRSVSWALEFLKVEHSLTSDPKELSAAQKLIFPGVGHFGAAARKLKESGLREHLRELVLDRKKPILGICLGMQLFAKCSEEGGDEQGLGLLDSTVRRMEAERLGLRLPHIGWNDVAANDLLMFRNIPTESCFYFVHSYDLRPNGSLPVATCSYGKPFVAAVEYGNIYGTQFHPEKSQTVGLQLLANFVGDD